MTYSELANRYAVAFYDIAAESKQSESFLSGLKTVHVIIEENKIIADFISTPLISSGEKVAVLQKAIKDSGLPTEVINFVLLLAKRGRLELLSNIIYSFRAREDELGGITRGTVRTAAPLSERQKENVLNRIKAFTKKKIILQYFEDQTIIGGLVAQVGGHTFDDSLSAHLQNMKEDLTRRIN
ncbi:MAG: ATP synthase F1 subunit delta [Bdellovibrionales bacterium RBG_16_40_8]|nr:MAG: ATP synthase F1 subunit delta [Bdellovibrionales bacterium RBG_16_40_8]